MALEEKERGKLLILVTLLAQGTQGDAPAVESNAALVRLPGLAAVAALFALSGFLVWLEHNRFGRVGLLGLVCVVVHLNLLLAERESWVETKTASRFIRLAVGENNMWRGWDAHAFRLFGF